MRPERFKVVSVLDEDIEMSPSERLAYAGSRDYALVKTKPGGRPVIFHVREVPHGLWEEHVDAADSYAEKFKRAFMVGVEKVENLPQDDGVSLASWAPAHRHPRTDAIIMDAEDVRRFSPAERQEIGSVIYTHSFLARRMQATYLLPSSLQEPLTSLAVRHAAANQNAAGQTISGGSSARSTQHPGAIAMTSELHGADSGNPTHVSAAEAQSP